MKGLRKRQKNNNNEKFQFFLFGLSCKVMKKIESDEEYINISTLSNFYFYAAEEGLWSLKLFLFSAFSSSEDFRYPCGP